VSFSIEQVRNNLLNPLLDRACPNIGLGHHDEEFIPPKSNNEITLADRREQSPSDPPQSVIPDVMPVVVVGFLEMINIDCQERNGMAVPLPSLLFLAQKLIKVQRLTAPVSGSRSWGPILLASGRAPCRITSPPPSAGVYLPFLALG